MTYDPFQTYANSGAYTGFGNPFQTPFNTPQNYGVNPAAAWNPLTAYQGQAGYAGINPQALFNPQAAYWQNPQMFGGLHHGISHNALLQQLAAQQLIQQIVAQQLAAQQFGLQQALPNQQSGMYPQVGQIGFAGQAMSPFGQPASPFGGIGVPLAPQSWVGQAGQLSGMQTNPILLAQLTARALQAQGIAPGVGFQG